MTSNAKKSTKKKTAKKAAGKKKTTKKPTRKKKAPAPAVPAVVQHTPSNPDTQLEVWQSYTRLRSYRAVHDETGIPRDTVRAVLNQDLGRIRMIAREFLEEYTAHLEEAGQRSMSLIQQAMELCSHFMAEVQAAAAEGRMTVIRDQNGQPMPVLDVVEFLQNCKILDQAMKVAEKTWQMSREFRLERQPQDGEGGDSASLSINFTKMSDYEIAVMLRAGGRPLPPALERCVQIVESQTKKPADAGG